MWQSEYHKGLCRWFVVIPVDERNATKQIALDRDGEPLQFWSEEGAQLHADARNRRERGKTYSA